VLGSEKELKSVLSTHQYEQSCRCQNLTLHILQGKQKRRHQSLIYHVQLNNWYNKQIQGLKLLPSCQVAGAD